MGPKALMKMLLASAAASLAACGGGGGGGGSGIISTPTPTPTPTGVLPPAQIGLKSGTAFAVEAIGYTYSANANGQGRTLISGPSGQEVTFSYNAAANAYDISLPGFQPGRLAGTLYNGVVGQVATSTTSRVTAGSSATLQPVIVTLPVPGSDFSPYTYTSFGSWGSVTSGTSGGTFSAGEFAYGIPTLASEMPISGSASYDAVIQGSMNAGTDSQYWLGGSATLLFDFGAGTLSGSMHPEIFDSFNGYFVDFGVYQFTQTVYAQGSTTFSGKFVVPGLPNANSFFDGTFTGPGAAEFMARFSAPFVQNGNQGTLSGAWIGRKCC